jgi:adenosylcobinamide-phosphate synthase
MAYLLDAFWGDPPAYPHPVRLLGKWIRFLEEKVAPEDHESEVARYAGCAIAGITIGGAWLSARALSSVPGRMAAETLILYTCLARKDLEMSAMRVAESVEKGKLEEAQRDLICLVGRDTWCLDAHGICRAAVESTAENLVDGVLAPLFWAAWGGAPAALVFKAISTLDSMVGYRNERYRKLGWCSARLDDLAVFPVARLSIPLIAAAAFIRGLDGRRALMIGFRDRLSHHSPNSAHAQAAFAGALGLRLGGAHLYGGRVRELPEIGEGTRDAEPHHVRDAVGLLNTTSLLGLVVALLFAGSKNFQMRRKKRGYGCGSMGG